VTVRELEKRIIDYVRMDLERGNIGEYSPVGIAYRDYERAVKVGKELKAHDWRKGGRG